MPDSLAALKQYFGYDKFLDYQQPIVERIAAGEELCVIMPTGAGKSLCYQLPILMTPGYGIVASPLIALMKDQVDALNARNIPAGCINSMVPFGEQREILDRAASGELKLLYVAPERFGVEFFREFLYRTPPKILVVDEAHCISQWGHDFRPAYLKLGQAAGKFNIPQICAFTATATPTVRTDIRRQLHRENMELFVAGFRRPNLAFKVVRCSGDGEKQRILKELIKDKVTTIVYAATRQAVDKLAEIPGIIGYHAGMSDADREKAQEQFMTLPHPVLAATNAFGMGIDRADVRKVIHYQLPGSIEAYYQEAGRAGRDGENAECIMLFSYADRYIQQFLIDMNNPPLEVISGCYAALRGEVRRSGVNHVELTMKELASLAGIKSDGQAGAALSVLEKLELINRDFQHHGRGEMVFKGDLKQLAMIHQLENTQRSRFIFRVIRQYGTQLLRPAEYSVGDLAEIAGLNNDQVKRVIQALNGDILVWQAGFAGRAVTLTDPELPMPELDRNEIEAKRMAENARLDEVVNYASTNRCRQAALIDYFGEDVTSWRCGCCDLCAVQEQDLRDPSPEERRAIRSILLAAANFNGRIGSGKLSRILTGSSEIDGWLRNNSDFGKLKGWKQNQVSALIQSLERAGCLERIDREGYPCLQIAEKGEEVMTGACEVKLDIASELHSPKSSGKKSVKAPVRKVFSETESQDDSELYEQLRQLRQQIASSRGLPLYAVLTNADLNELVSSRPLTAEEAVKLPGIGSRKAKYILPPFLEIIRKFTKTP